jgi:hypothetical protein
MADGGIWRAPATGEPAKPSEVAPVDPNALADAVVSRLVVPKGPTRGLNSGLLRLDLAGTYPLIAGLLKGVTIQSGLVNLGAGTRCTSLVELLDGNFDVAVASGFYDNFSTAAGFDANAMLANLGDIGAMFANGLRIRCTVQNAGYASASWFWIAVYYNSIPIGGQ